MARNQIISDSDEDKPTVQTSDGTGSGAVTPSTAATSVHGSTTGGATRDAKGKGRQTVIELSSDSEDSGMDLDDEDRVSRKAAQLAARTPKPRHSSSSVQRKRPLPRYEVVVTVPRASTSESEKKVVPKIAAMSDEEDVEAPEEDAADTEQDGVEELDELEGSDDDEDLPVAKVKVKTRKGATITAAMKQNWKKKSKYEKSQIYLNANHPELVSCWEDLAAIPLPIPMRAIQPEGFSLKLLPFQQEGLDWMIKAEAGAWSGGLLADEMGMGKTAQTIALVLSDYNKDVRQPTLVLAPTVAIIQWKTEFEKFTTNFKVLVWHGSNRLDSVSAMSEYDVVLTSYAIMESSFRREIKGFMKKGVLMKEDSIIHKLNWHRIVLDEAHNIKDRSSNQAKAAFALKGKFRWCLSGTPLQNRVGELYSLIRFIGVDPFAHYYCKQCDCKSLHWLSVMGPCKECKHSGMQHVCYWNNEILKPIQQFGAQSGAGGAAFAKLTSLLQRLMLRRTKVERADDLGLPPRVVNVRRDFFTEEEEELYKSLYQDVNRKFNTYAHEGTVLNNYSNIFTLITRMRQLADHPDLCLKSTTSMAVEHYASDAPQTILTCRLCLDEAEEPIASSCKHIFCRTCVRQYMESAVEVDPQCPVCHLHMTIDVNQDAIEQLGGETGAPKQGFLSRIDPSKYKTSTKIEALVEELSKLRREDSSEKSLVFSQFTSMLDLVERRLQLGGFKTVRLTGGMSPISRHNVITKFTNDPAVTVFLISLKAGGVALNLVEASRVFILDPWWNPAVEYQAMDRIHRLGQHRPVIVTRLIIENSIESRILELQRKKEAMSSSTLGDDDSGMGRLTPDDLRFLFSL